VLRRELAMEIDTVWLTQQAEILVSPESLSDLGLRALCALAQRNDYTGANLLEARRSIVGDIELVLLEAVPALGQKLVVNDIKSSEPIAVLRRAGDPVPNAYPVRQDFPQTMPHMNLGFPGTRRSLCLFDAKPSDVAHIYSPDLLIERIKWWLEETAHGDLHGDEQPLDPAIAPGLFDLILPQDFDPKIQRQYFAVKCSNRDLSPFMLVPVVQETEQSVECYGATVLITDPAPHGAMLDLPQNIQQLLDTYSYIGTDLIALLKEQYSGDLNAGAKAAQVNSSLLLIIVTPLLREDGSIGARSTRAYLNRQHTLRQLGLYLGLLSEAGDTVARLLREVSPDTQALENTPLLPLNVVFGFDVSQARLSSGRDDEDSGGFVAIGAGAIGSQVIDNCVRMGEMDWIVVDNDFLLPHNLARHDSPGWLVGHSKSDITKMNIDHLFGNEITQALHEAVGALGESDALKNALTSDRRIVDLSASLDVSRSLALRDYIKHALVSYFVNPSGTSLIELCESHDRSINLIDVEMTYYWSIFAQAELNDHLVVGDLVHIGSCRDASVSIPQSRMAMFAAIASGRIIDPTQNPEYGQITIWNWQPDGGISVRTCAVPFFMKVVHGSWDVSVSEEVMKTISEHRKAADKAETGGILIGSCDRKNHSIYITGVLPAPSDSHACASYFERGGHEVEKMIMSAERLTMRHLSYIGEWHTHPNGMQNQPSSDDDNLLNWIAERRELYAMPGVMLIAGDNGLRVLTRLEGITLESTE
jgi:integrative and conjugative element protein (TIGR02256 family)